MIFEGGISNKAYKLISNNYNNINIYNKQVALNWIKDFIRGNFLYN